MPRPFVIPLLSLAIVAALPAFAADKSSGDNGAVDAGGLVCFSITPAKGGGPSCDELCQTNGAVCVGLKMNGATDPSFGCADPIDLLRGGNAVAGCRCCAVGR
jgi:hypothetical protein